MTVRRWLLRIGAIMAIALREALVKTATGAVDPLGAGVWLRGTPR